VPGETRPRSQAPEKSVSLKMAADRDVLLVLGAAELTVAELESVMEKGYEQ
jgi:hypothetical protein